MKKGEEQDTVGVLPDELYKTDLPWGLHYRLYSLSSNQLLSKAFQ